MTGRIVEVAEAGRHLAISRGHMVVKADGEELGRVPLDDVAALVANGHGMTYSNNLLLALAERNAVVVLCGANHMPAALLWPMDSHHIQSARMRAQVALPRTAAKRLWQSLVRTKIKLQAAVLEAQGQASGGFDLLARKVRSGDPENMEAQAARRYWPLLMGTDFRRDRSLPGANGLLNYGYTIVRSTVARGVMAAGLHPTLGIHHIGRGNPMCLVDDLMEPFRPVVDLVVARLCEAGMDTVDRETKRVLASVPTFDMATNEGTTPLSTCAMRLATSLAQVCEGERRDLEFPLEPLPLEWPEIAPVGGHV